MDRLAGGAPRWGGCTTPAGLVLATLALLDCASVASLPPPPGPRGATTPAETAIEHAPVCVGSAVASAGALADILYYRTAAVGGGRVAVGYFAFFSEERPWGNNWLTWSVLPALAVDAVYSRALLLGPGLQRAMYGAGDVEGFAIVYDVMASGALRVDHAMADDRDERPIVLSRRDVFALDAQRPTFYSEVWSHQLGGKGARSRADLAYVRCFEGSSIRPLPDAVAREFRVEGRADPAHVERLGPPVVTLPAERVGSLDDRRFDRRD